MDRRRVLAVVLLTTWCAAAEGAQFYVSTAGSDASAGTAQAPWRTLQHAAEQVGPGERVTVRAGTYVGFQLETSGAPSAPIEFIAEPGVLVNQPNPVRGQHGINLENASHVARRFKTPRSPECAERESRRGCLPCRSRTAPSAPGPGRSRNAARCRSAAGRGTTSSRWC